MLKLTATGKPPPVDAPDNQVQPEKKGTIHLTFDDGPDREWTPRVLDALHQAQVTATFFLIGTASRRLPGVVRDIESAGHGIGNHTWSHAHPWSMSAANARSQVRDGAAAIADITGRMPAFYRPPHGRNRRCMTDEAARCGASLVMWNRSAIDWGLFGRGPAIAKRLAKAGAGEIILMHDGRNQANRPDELMLVLPGWLNQIRQRGLDVHPLQPSGQNF